MMISRGMIYGKQLDELIWSVKERAAIYGFVAGALITNIIWIILT